MKQQLHYHISLARLTLFATFGGLLLILMFARSGAAQTQTFNPTYEMSSEGNIQNFTVPTGVTSLTITAKGSVGGGTSGGKGATVKATFAVTPSALLKIVVGAKGHSSTNDAKYGGGGGGSFVAVGDINEANLLIAAGGGGGGGLTPGGDASTTAGDGSGGGPGFGTLGGGGGGAGINGNGEDAGLEPCTGGAGCGGFKASAGGSSGNGGAVGGFGGGGGAGFGGGGGGGYTGGKGGNQSLTVNFEGEGGGGGSSYTKSGATAVSASVNNTGVGQVIIEWTATINPATPNDFITTWANTTGSFTQLQFNALTTGPVAYTYTTNLGQSGSGTFTSAVINNGVTLNLGNTIAANEVLTLVMESDNLKQVQFGLFTNSNSITRGNLTNVTQWGTAAWNNMQRAFRDCFNLNITATDAPTLTGVTNMNEMFYGCSILNGPANIGTWNVSSVTNMSGLFQRASVFNVDISGWNTAAVTDMNGMFSIAQAFNQNIGNWNTSAVTNMSGMFSNAIAFNQAINYNSVTGAWNTAAVTNMSSMFGSATTFNQAIGNWNTAAVTNMNGMFGGATAFNQNISTWNTAAVTNMSNMFQGSAFNQPVGNWDVSKVTNMGQMFQSATAFNKPIGNWDVSKVTNMQLMFYNASTFNQDISTWNVSSVTTMNNMFNGASAFSQNLGRWTLKASVDLASMLLASGMNCENYSKTLVGWANNPATPNGLNIASTHGLQYGTDAASAVSILTGKSWNFGVTPAQRHTSSGTNCLPTPTLSTIANQATCDGQTISNIAITIGGDLDAVLTATDDNTNLNPTNTFGGTGANRTLSIATTAGQVGAITVTITATSSFGTTATRSFLLEVGNKTAGAACNINQTEGTFIGQFRNDKKIGQSFTPTCSGNLSSIKVYLNSAANIGSSKTLTLKVFNGEETNFNATALATSQPITLVNGQTGSLDFVLNTPLAVTNALTYSFLISFPENFNAVEEQFHLNVAYNNPYSGGRGTDIGVFNNNTDYKFDATIGNVSYTSCNAAPTIAAVATQSTCDNVAKTVNLTVADADSDPVTVTATSGNQTLVPNGNITYNAGVLTITPANNQVGEATITLTPNDGKVNGTAVSFKLEVGNKVAGSPTLSDFATLNKVTFLAKGNGDQIIATSFDDKLVRTINSDGSTATTYTNSGFVTGVAKNPSFSSTFFNDWQAKKTVGLNSLNQLNDLVVGLGNPQGLHISNGKLYIADFGNNKVIEYNLTTNTSSDFITTVQAPGDITSDASGNMYITDNSSNKIVKRAPDGTLTDYVTIPGIQNLKGLATDAAGNLYFSSTVNDRIYKVPAGGGTPILYVSSGLLSPIGLLVVNDDLYSANYGSGKIIKITPGPATYETCNAKPVFNPTTLANQTLCVSPTQVSLPNTSITVTDPDGSITGTVVTSSNPSLITATNAGTASAVQLSLTQQANQSGTTTITIESTDNRGAKSNLQFEIRVNAVQLDNNTVTDVLCFGNSTGALTVTPTGGTAPYSYIWTKGGSPVGTDSPTITGQSAGVYNVTVSDKFGCSTNRNLTITQPAAALTLTKESTNISCYGLNNGTASVTPSGGTAPYYYDWRDIGATPFSSNQSVTNRAPGYYTVRVSDAKGCNAEATFTLTQPAEIVISRNPTDAVVCQGTDASLTAEATGGTLTYQWYRLTIANGETVALTNGTSYQNVTTTTLTIRGNLADNGLYRYFMRASQSASCFKNSSQATVTVNPAPNAVATPSAQTICSEATITSIALSSNISGTTYSWTRDNTTAVTGIAANGSGNISGSLVNTTNAPVTVTFTIMPTTNNCPGTAISATVIVNPTPNAVATPAAQISCSAAAINPIVLTGNVTGTTYTWTRDVTAAVTGITANGSGNISGALTNTTNAPATVTFSITPTANNCPGTPITATVTITDVEPPTISCPANISVNNTVGLCGAIVNFTTPMGTDNCSGATTTQTAGLPSGATFPIGTTTNSYRVTDAVGNQVTCSFTVTVTDTEPPTITCPANIMVCEGTLNTYAPPVGLDKCMGTVTTQMAGLPSDRMYPTGMTTNTFKVTAANGQTATCSFTITVQSKPTIYLSINGQTLNEGNAQTLCDTDTDLTNTLLLNVTTACVAATPLWRTQVGSGVWSDWSATVPSKQPSNNTTYRYQAACDASCPVTYTEPISLTINYRSATPQNVSLIADGTTVNSGESKTICNAEGNTLAFNATCGSGEILLYSVDGSDYTSLVPSQLVDGNVHNYRVRCRKADGTPSCVETESAVMSLKITPPPAGPTVSIMPTSNCGTPTAFSGNATCGSLTTVWYNAATNQALPSLPTTTPNATTSYYARCQSEAGCLSEKSNVVTFTITPVNDAPVVTVSAELVCTGTEVTVSTTCPAGTSALWNTGVTGTSFKVAFNNVTKATYTAKCVAVNGCQSRGSAPKTVSWKAFELTFINVGQSKSATKSNDKAAWASQFITPDAGPSLDYSTEANPTIYFSENVNKTAPRFWTIQVESCTLGTDGSVTYDMLATPELGVRRSFNTHENNAPYFMYANRDGFTELYAQNHPAYGFYQENGNGGNVYDEGLPKGLYKLGIRYWDQKGQGSIYPSTRQPVGNVLAYQEYWFRIQSKNGVGTGAARTADLSSRRDLSPLSFAEVAPNPVSSIMRLKVSDAKNQKVNVSLTDASGRALLQRSFVPETNAHQEEFEVSQLSNGMYFLKVNTTDKQATLKVIKEQ